MKNIILQLLLGVLALSFASCSTSQKVALHAQPGTEIYSLSQTKLGTVPNSGKLELKIDDNDYSALYLSKRPGTDVKVPFALDYKHKSRSGTYFLGYIGLTLSVIGSLSAGVAALCGLEGPIFYIFGAAALGGTCFWDSVLL